MKTSGLYSLPPPGGDSGDFFQLGNVFIFAFSKERPSGRQMFSLSTLSVDKTTRSRRKLAKVKNCMKTATAPVVSALPSSVAFTVRQE